MTADRRLLVVIPTLNEAGTIDGVLSALGRDVPVGWRVLFVVADGGSNDGTVERVEALAAARTDLRLLRNPLRLQSAAVNLAVETFGGGADILVRCDAHAGYPPRFLASLVTTMDRTGADSVVVPMDSVGTRGVQKAVAWVSNTVMGTGGAAHRGGHKSGFVDHGHHAAITIKAFQAAGGYDPTMSHNEDAEFDGRLAHLGGRIYLDADIRLAYYPRASLWGLFRQYFNYGRGRAQTVRRHPSTLRLRQIAVPAHFCLLIFSFVLAVFGWPETLLYPAAYLAALLAGAAAIGWRHRSLLGLLCAPAAIVMHTAWAMGFFKGLTVALPPAAPRLRIPVVADVAASMSPGGSNDETPQR